MFQTWWDLNKQNIRKVIDALSGLVAGLLISQGEWGAALAPAVAIAVNYAWFWFDNKNKISVGGLEKAGASNAAAVVEAVVKGARK